MSLLVGQQGIVCDFNTSGSWVVLSPIEQSIKQKIEALGTPLGEWKDIKIYRGVLTGCNEAFIIDTAKREEILANCQSDEERARTAQIIRPILRGRDIGRYSCEWAGLYLIATFPACHYDIEDYPAVRDYLLSFGKERLAQSGETRIINGKTIKARKATHNQWFEMQDSIAYWEDFGKPKLIYSEITQEPQFYFDERGEFYPEATTFIMVGENLEYLYDVLHSKIATYLFKTFYAGGGLGNDGYRYKKAFLELLPIPKPMRKYERSEIDYELAKLYQFTDEEIKAISSSVKP